MDARVFVICTVNYINTILVLLYFCFLTFDYQKNVQRTAYNQKFPGLKNIESISFIASIVLIVAPSPSSMTIK